MLRTRGTKVRERQTGDFAFDRGRIYWYKRLGRATNPPLLLSYIGILETRLNIGKSQSRRYPGLGAVCHCERMARTGLRTRRRVGSVG